MECQIILKVKTSARGGSIFSEKIMVEITAPTALEKFHQLSL
jgi:hypothetical protein